MSAGAIILMDGFVASNSRELRSTQMLDLDARNYQAESNLPLASSAINLISPCQYLASAACLIIS
jgi:hypothetical protein